MATTADLAYLAIPIDALACAETDEEAATPRKS